MREIFLTLEKILGTLDFINPEDGFTGDIVDNFSEFIKDDHLNEYYDEHGSDKEHGEHENHHRGGPNIDFSNEDNYLAKSENTKISYNSPTIDTTADVNSFHGVWVGTCKSGDVGILSVSPRYGR